MFPDIHVPGGRSPNEAKELAAAFKVIGPDRSHVGLLYQLPNEKVRFCHLADHHALENEEPNETYSWLQSALGDEARKSLAMTVDGIVRENGADQIPYSPHYEGKYFDEETLSYIPGTPSKGLTCATFIMAIFQYLGLPLLRDEEWKHRSGDNEWVEWIAGYLEHKSQNDTDQALLKSAQAIRSKPLVARFRPEEVAAGVSCTDAPLGFESAVQVGEFIVASHQAEGAASKALE
jgi:hypothetical protein